ncbi:MAG: S41 family peptidase [Planctomycetota bacterium]
MKNARTSTSAPLRLLLVAGLALSGSAGIARPVPSVGGDEELFEQTFDAHWERLRDDYPYFELYGVDWDAERAEHRPRAVAAADATEFAWELARLFAALPDPHVSFIPSIDTIGGRWSYPDVDTKRVERRTLAIAWPAGTEPAPPPAFAADPHAYPEIVQVQGLPLAGTAEILAAGPLGSPLSLRLRWPDGSETDHVVRRPDESNLPPPEKHFGERWLVTGRVGSVGYLRVRTFDPKLATLGPDGKMTTMLRAALAELKDTSGLILDLRGNGGGLVAASDPFLGNLVTRTQRYRWGNSGGKARVIRPRTPRYRGDVVALVDGRSASGGEWAARILRDAGRATVIGERTAGAEAAVKRSEGPDGSVVTFSAWPMAEPGARSFQEVGIELDHALPLTVADVRALGFEAARARVERARLKKALEVLGAPADGLESLLVLASDPAEATPDAED